MTARTLLPGAIAVLVGTVSLLCLPIVIEEEIFRYEVIEVMHSVKPSSTDPVTLLFVGDIMLGRKVEWYMDTHGYQYPFLNVIDFLQKPDLTIGNFEGVVTKIHIPTPSMTFQFSIREEYLPYLHEIGFDVFSLANNHTLDYGTSSLAYTRSLCASSGLVCVGTPKGIDSFSSTVIDVRGIKIGFLSLETINGLPLDSALHDELTRLASTSDTQIALVHWGTEYSLTHSYEQEQLAHTLIDYGADTIIGHHPHVIQDIELYKGKPVFYSLGNFIFDQYFSDEVQEELAVHMAIDEASIEYTLVPFTSTTTQSQPNFMTETQSQKIFQRVLPATTSSSAIDRENGTMKVQKD